jgi:hypothetical protein
MVPSPSALQIKSPNIWQRLIKAPSHVTNRQSSIPQVAWGFVGLTKKNQYYLIGRRA